MYSADRAQPDNAGSMQGRQGLESNLHSVHFYEDDSLFLDSLSEFTGAALGAGGACVIVATKAHRSALAERLKGNGVDLSFLTAVNRFVPLDAHETLARFMVGGQPDEGLFNATMEPELLRVRRALRGHSSSVVAFGEMVTVLWKDGEYEAAIKLEKLWDDLAQRQAFSLRCAYPIGLFSGHAQYDLFRQVCSHHNQVIAAGHDNEEPGDLHRMISSVQQKAWTMQAVMHGREEEITKLKQIEERLQRSEEFARCLIESSADCVMVIDRNGRVEYISASGLSAFEREDRQEIVGQPWTNVWSEEVRPQAHAAIATAMAGGAGAFVAKSKTGSGSQKWWDVKITPIANGGEGVHRLMAVARDITELRAAQQAAIESEKMAIAGRMSATIAHEINNPLEAVTNFIYLARMTEGLPEEASRHLEIADQELARAAQISRQTLGFYRETSRLNQVPVSKLVENVLTTFKRRLDNKRITASISVEPGIELYGKEGEMRQVLLNLTANAVDACEAGGKLWFRARRSRNWKDGNRKQDGQEGIRIMLADNGSGMTPEVQRRIFEPFFTTKAGHGTGIGLWVTKCLVEQQGGFLHFRSNQSQMPGTVVSLFLPAAQKASLENAEEAA